MSLGAILITGSTGFVGRHLMASLLDSGRDLVLAVRDVRSFPASWHGRDRVRIIETGSIETANNLGEALAGVDTVVHLAGLAHVRHSSGLDTPPIIANAIATERLASAAAEAGVRTFVHMSSAFAVSDNHSATIVDDTTNRVPSTSYGKSKRLAEQKLLDATKTGMCGISLRPPLIVGAAAKGNWRLLQKLAATPLPLPFATVNNRRSLVAVDTIVKTIVHLCARPWPADKSGNYCIADSGTLSLPQIVTELRAGMGARPRLFPCPPSLIRGAALLTGQQGRIAGMLGDLELDAHRFTEAFAFNELPDVRSTVRRSGMLYLQSQSGEPFDPAT